ncbi:MAG: homocysteine S-methyltransferase family protein [Candidatus Atribacteria bacterium]
MKVDINIKEEIKKQLDKRPLLIDGAMGTMLQKYGLKSGECSEEWNISHPQVVQNIHQEYVKAGADIILTNTFGANRIKLSNFGRENDALKLNESAVNIAKDAINRERSLKKRIFIAGSVGPTGKILEPYGDLKVSEVYKNYKEQTMILEKTGVDLIILETFYDLEEIKAALKAAKENTNLMVVASMTFDKNLKTIYGVDPEKAVIDLEGEGADGVGANCGTGPEVIYKVLKIMKKVSQTYLMVEPNAGIPEFVEGKVVYPASPNVMADYAEKFIGSGISLIGGCCGTTPLHIKAMSAKIKNKNFSW